VNGIRDTQMGKKFQRNAIFRLGYGQPTVRHSVQDKTISLLLLRLLVLLVIPANSSANVYKMSVPVLKSMRRRDYKSIIILTNVYIIE